MTLATKLISTLFIFLTLPALGQHSKSRIGFKLLPGVSDTHDPTVQQNFQNRIHPRFTFNFGGQYIHSIKDSTFFIETGFYYTDRGTKQSDFISEYYTSQGNFTKKSDIYIHNYYFSLPLLFRFERRHFYVSFGGSIDYYSHTKWIWTPEEDNIEKNNYRPNGFSNSFKFGANLNIGAQIKIAERIGLYIEGNINPSEFYRNPFDKKLFFFWNYLLGTGLTLKI